MKRIRALLFALHLSDVLGENLQRETELISDPKNSAQDFEQSIELTRGLQEAEAEGEAEGAGAGEGEGEGEGDATATASAGDPALCTAANAANTDAEKEAACIDATNSGNPCMWEAATSFCDVVASPGSSPPTHNVESPENAEVMESFNRLKEALANEAWNEAKRLLNYDSTYRSPRIHLRGRNRIHDFWKSNKWRRVYKDNTYRFTEPKSYDGGMVVKFRWQYYGGRGTSQEGQLVMGYGGVSFAHHPNYGYKVVDLNLTLSSYDQLYSAQPRQTDNEWHSPQQAEVFDRFEELVWSHEFDSVRELFSDDAQIHTGLEHEPTIGRDRIGELLRDPNPDGWSMLFDTLAFRDLFRQNDTAYFMFTYQRGDPSPNGISQKKMFNGEAEFVASTATPNALVIRVLNLKADSAAELASEWRMATGQPEPVPAPSIADCINNKMEVQHFAERIEENVGDKLSCLWRCQELGREQCTAWAWSHSNCQLGHGLEAHFQNSTQPEWEQPATGNMNCTKPFVTERYLEDCTEHGRQFLDGQHVMPDDATSAKECQKACVDRQHECENWNWHHLLGCTLIRGGWVTYTSNPQDRAGRLECAKAAMEQIRPKPANGTDTCFGAMGANSQGIFEVRHGTDRIRLMLNTEQGGSRLNVCDGDSGDPHSAHSGNSTHHHQHINEGRVCMQDDKWGRSADGELNIWITRRNTQDEQDTSPLRRLVAPFDLISKGGDANGWYRPWGKIPHDQSGSNHHSEGQVIPITRADLASEAKRLKERRHREYLDWLESNRHMHNSEEGDHHEHLHQHMSDHHHEEPHEENRQHDSHDDHDHMDLKEVVAIEFQNFNFSPGGYAVWFGEALTANGADKNNSGNLCVRAQFTQNEVSGEFPCNYEESRVKNHWSEERWEYCCEKKGVCKPSVEMRWEHSDSSDSEGSHSEQHCEKKETSCVPKELREILRFDVTEEKCCIAALSLFVDYIGKTNDAWRITHCYNHFKCDQGSVMPNDEYLEWAINYVEQRDQCGNSVIRSLTAEAQLNYENPNIRWWHNAFRRTYDQKWEHNWMRRDDHHRSMCYQNGDHESIGLVYGEQTQTCCKAINIVVQRDATIDGYGHNLRSSHCQSNWGIFYDRTEDCVKQGDYFLPKPEIHFSAMWEMCINKQRCGRSFIQGLKDHKNDPEAHMNAYVLPKYESDEVGFMKVCEAACVLKDDLGVDGPSANWSRFHGDGIVYGKCREGYTDTRKEWPTTHPDQGTCANMWDDETCQGYFDRDDCTAEVQENCRRTCKKCDPPQFKLQCVPLIGFINSPCKKYEPKCPEKPVTDSNVEVFCSGTQEGDYCSASCKPDYFLEKGQYYKCLPGNSLFNGQKKLQWMGPGAVCKPTECVIHRGNMRRGISYLRESVQFPDQLQDSETHHLIDDDCQEGFYPLGVIRCQQGRIVELPRCVKHGQHHNEFSQRWSVLSSVHLEVVHSGHSHEYNSRVLMMLEGHLRGWLTHIEPVRAPQEFKVIKAGTSGDFNPRAEVSLDFIIDHIDEEETSKIWENKLKVIRKNFTQEVVDGFVKGLKEEGMTVHIPMFNFDTPHRHVRWVHRDEFHDHPEGYTGMGDSEENKEDHGEHSTEEHDGKDYHDVHSKRWWFLPQERCHNHYDAGNFGPDGDPSKWGGDEFKQWMAFKVLGDWCYSPSVQEEENHKKFGCWCSYWYYSHMHPKEWKEVAKFGYKCYEDYGHNSSRFPEGSKCREMFYGHGSHSIWDRIEGGRDHYRETGKYDYDPYSEHYDEKWDDKKENEQAGGLLQHEEKSHGTGMGQDLRRLNSSPPTFMEAQENEQL